MAVDPTDRSTAISLTNSLAGGDIDIHIGDKIYSALPSSEENYDVLISRAESFLYKKDFDGAYEVLQKIPNDVPQTGNANLLYSLVILAGQSFNAISPVEISKVERSLISARHKMENKLIPSILLAILETDYYNYHGESSENEISMEQVASKLRTKQLSEKDKQLLGLLKMSREARNKLGLKF